MDIPLLTITDIVAGFCVLLSGLLGLARGFLEEILWLIVLISTAISAIYLFTLIMPFIHHFVSLIWLASLVIMVITLLGSVIIFSFLVHIMIRETRTIYSSINHVLGMIFGFGRGLLIISMTYLIIDSILYPRPLWLETSRSLYLMQQGAALIKAIILTPTGM